MALTESIAGYAGGVAAALKGVFFSAGSFLSPLPLAFAVAIAGLVLAARARRAGRTLSLSGLWRELFPKEIWRHPSARQDLFIILINDGLLFFLPGLAAVIVASVIVTTPAANAAGYAAPMWAMILFGVYMALVWDFFATFAHYLKHKIPVLWEFHKVHHCAEVLTPLTAMRRHPVETVVSALIVGAGLALAALLWRAAFGAPGATTHVGGVLAIVYLWRLIGYNIRHSHVWISYGTFWNRLLMSPAHHQLHHSREQRHYDCNFGHIFTFWDRLFGTLYQPIDGEEFEFGIEREENAELNTLAALYIRPLQKAAARFAPSKTSLPATPAE